MNERHNAVVASGGGRFSPWELIGALLSSPVVSLTLAVVVAVIVAVVTSRVVAGTAIHGPRGERVALGGVALAVAGAWMVDVLVRGYAFRLWEILDLSATVSWWRFAIAPTVAAVGLLAVALAVRTVAPRRTLAVATASRRTWTSFGPRRGIPSFLGLATVTIVLAITFGSMSTALEPGWAAHIALAVPNTDTAPLVLTFPGWAYGVPLIVALLVLSAALFLALRRNAVRPFASGIPLDVERARRTAVARDAVLIAVAATALSLAGMLQLARSAVVSTVSTMTASGVGPARSVQVPHVDLILAGGFLAPILEIAGCVLLAVVVARGIGVAGARRGRTLAPVGVPA